MQSPPAGNLPESTHQPRREEPNSSEGTRVLVEPPEPTETLPQHNVNDDMEVAEASDVSSVDSGLGGIIDNRRVPDDVHSNDDSPSPSDTESPAQHTSNATVAPVDIISRKPLPGIPTARLEQSSSRMERTSTRTPSPNGLSSSSGDALAGVEGPMTPRNDAGPFIFDGSAGRGADVQLAALATMNLSATAESPLPETPQPAA